MKRTNLDFRNMMRAPALGVWIALVFILAACGATGATPTTVPTNGPSATGDASESPGGAGSVGPDMAQAESDGRVVLYTTAPTEMMDAVIDAFEAEYPAITIEVFRSSSTAIDAKFQAEVANNRVGVDVLMNNSYPGFADFHRRGLFLEYNSPHYDVWSTSADLPEGWLEPGYYFPAATWAWGAAVNTDLVSAEQIAGLKDWPDVPALANDAGLRMVAGDVAGAVGNYHFYSIMRELYGMEMFEDMAAADTDYHVGNTAMSQALASGEAAIAMAMLEAFTYPDIEAGAPIEMVFFESGHPSQGIFAGIPKDAPRPEAAKVFVDWIMSLEGQTIVSESFGSLSPLPEVDVLADRLEPFRGAPLLSYEVDWDKLMLLHGEWLAEWRELTGR